jgi:hypothetical protein
MYSLLLKGLIYQNPGYNVFKMSKKKTCLYIYRYVYMRIYAYYNNFNICAHAWCNLSICINIHNVPELITTKKKIIIIIKQMNQHIKLII